MRLDILLTCFLAGAFSTGLQAQVTWTVDSGGGAQFSDVQPAVDAASPGDTIVVNAGFYTGFSVSKGVRILVDPAAEFGFILGPGTTIEFVNIPAGQTAVLHGLSVLHRGFPIGVGTCAGRVHLESCSPQTGLGVWNSTQVTVHDCRFEGTPALEAVGSTVLVTQTNLVPFDSFPGVTEAMRCRESKVYFAHGTILGSEPLFPFSELPAVELLSGELTIAGDAATEIVAGGGSNLGPAIELRGGHLILDSRVTVVPSFGQPPIRVGLGTLAYHPTPSLRADLTGQDLSVETHAAPGSQSILVIGAVRPVPLPLPFGSIWFSAPAILDSGAIPANGVRTFNATIPVLPPGIDAVLQGVILTPTLELTLPVVRTFG